MMHPRGKQCKIKINCLVNVKMHHIVKYSKYILKTRKFIVYSMFISNIEVHNKYINMYIQSKTPKPNKITCKYDSQEDRSLSNSPQTARQSSILGSDVGCRPGESIFSWLT